MKRRICLLLGLVSVLAGSAGAADFWVENRIVYNANLPHDRDGLKDDVDYFPEDYLKSVADCGMNGIWMWVRWRQVANTFLTPRTADGERRIAKLRSIARKCRRHGIKLWIFGIEPASFKPGDQLPVEHPELKGAHFKSIDWSVWCPSEPQTLRYLEEAACDIFTQVPELGGFLNIANGENLSTCLDALWDSPADTWKADTRCARCAGREAWRLYADVSEAIVRGIRRAGGEQRYISWFYQPGSTPVRNPWVADCAAHAPDGVTFMYNFESGIVKNDLGRYRCGGDYWLSQPGPGAPFKELAAASARTRRRVGAKIQTCNSHEIATLPYIPVPGALYRKYWAMRAYGVRDVLQGWFFGGDPSLMLKAAGDLSRGEFPSDEDSFLSRFANRTFGPDCAADAVAVWKSFSTAYERYPLCNMMGYYGPFHAGIAWPLHADVTMTGLPQAWVPDEPEAGDMIGDCLRGYDLDEAERITERMASEVDGVEACLVRLAGKAPEALQKDVGIMKAFRLQVLAARDVFCFYRLRRDAIAAAEVKDLPRAESLIAEMKGVVESSRALTAAMLPLAEADERLGFHGEAAQRLYDPPKLRARLEELDRTSRRLDEIAAAVRGGKPWPRVSRESCRANEKVTGDDVTWKFTENADGDLVFSGSFAASRGCVSFTLCDLAATRSPIVVRIDSEKGLLSESDFVNGTSVREGDGVSFSLTCKAGMWKHNRVLRPRWLLISAVPKENLRGAVGLWPKCLEPVTCRLALPANVPVYFGHLED